MSNVLRPSLGPYGEFPAHQLLERAAARLPGKIAIIDGERRSTFRQLERHSARLATALAGLGVTKGERVGVLAPNCLEYAIAFYAITRIGAAVTPINAAYREAEVAYQLNDSEARTLIVHEAFMPVVGAIRHDVPALRHVIVISSHSDEPGSFWDLIAHAEVSPPLAQIRPREDVAALPYSSGTTGLPKGVMLTHFNLSSNLRQLLDMPGETGVMRQDDVTLVHLPLFHIYGMQALMNSAIAKGATLVMMGRFNMEQFLTLLARHRVTQIYTVPPVAINLIGYPDLRRFDLSALRVAWVASAPFSADLQGKLRDTLGCPVLQGYGMTELSPVANIDFMQPGFSRLGSVGHPIADTEEKVVSLSDGFTPVSPGETGELLVRGPQVMKGYHNNAAATADTITEDGWLRTGDIVRVDSDGYVWIVDRKKELIKYNAFQVPPAELEALLLTHPAVQDAAVIGKPDPRSGEVPKAFVVMRPGSGVSAQELMDFVAGRVAGFKRVREVEFVESLPKSPSGKLLRRTLLEQERARIQQGAAV